MLKKKRWFVVLTALAAATVAGALVFGQADEDTPLSGTFLGKVAENLGVSVEELLSAITQARLAEIDEALEEGLITEEQANLLRERLEAFQAELKLIEEALAEGKITQDQAELMLGGRGLMGFGRMGMRAFGQGRMGHGPRGCGN
ncbi:MAG: Uncharacterized protein XD60_1798 [Acetothermia bacterium 64_32]|nr:MAG: Uncharacterized protein XD60_1798 [Acetothermia bacterium 64_32]MBC7098851.1 hypothetical protein [Candidatus Bipolaricaulota bacterium]HAF71292.1 hypothetical protein [Candidatus Acetothermia bacterium]